MPANRNANASRAPAQRSAITNRSAVALNVNGRSASARRYRDLLESLGAEIGDDLTEVERLQIRNVATLQLHAEDQTARLIRGEHVDAEQITRAANGATRALAALRRRKAVVKPPARSLADHMATRRAGGDA